MKPFLVFACVSILVLAGFGCNSKTASGDKNKDGGSDAATDPEDLLMERMKIMNALADAFDAAASKEKIAKLKKQLKANEKQLKGVKLPDDAKEELRTKHEKNLSKAEERLARSESSYNLKQISIRGSGEK